MIKMIISDVDISDSKMNDFLQKHEEKLENLVKYHIKKIHEFSTSQPTCRSPPVWVASTSCSPSSGRVEPFSRMRTRSGGGPYGVELWPRMRKCSSTRCSPPPSAGGPTSSHGSSTTALRSTHCDPGARSRLPPFTVPLGR